MLSTNNRNRRKKVRRGRKIGRNGPRESTTTDPMGYSKARIDRAGSLRYLGFPDCQDLAMRYVDMVPLTCTAGVIASDNWYTNGLFDPYVAAGGHQPMGFDQAMAYYTFAVVKSAVITARFYPQSAAAVAVPVVVGIQTRDTTNSLYTNWETCLEAGFPIATISSIKPSATVRSKWGYQSFTGGTSLAISDTANTTAGNCARTEQWNVFLQSMDQASTSLAYRVVVEIDYVVTLSNPRLLPAS